ncbi:MAG: hypothetical protein HKO59_02545 [Phycisphaerales bacterium]|nr:hypothetical protein [Phycisphaerae bacterium]NNF41789.1 hypothetical protein [Phycisphaerales bacterium]NNM24860.1 hypothetical protein [Phycisphaerales bacterium]
MNAVRFLTLLAAGLLAGCQGTVGPAANEIGRGTTLELFVARSGGSFARYRVREDGTMAFAGGRDAIAGDDSWSGPLEPAERERLASLVAGWAGPAATAGAAEVYTIRWRDEAGHWRRERAADGDPVVSSLDEVLAHAARRRHASILDQLPKPSRETSP